MIEPNNVDGDMVIIPKMLASQSNIPIIDRIRVSIHAHFFLFHRPYARIRDTRPKAVEVVKDRMGK